MAGSIPNIHIKIVTNIMVVDTNSSYSLVIHQFIIAQHDIFTVSPKKNAQHDIVVAWGKDTGMGVGV